ncbi:MAG TPA: hypothetical protein VE981_00780 [Planctomycetota bacterium]|nr:hypothetical protein [Planctomycetota bacterium]
MTCRVIIPGVLALGVLMGAAFEMSAKDVMAAANKGKDSLLNKVLAGKGTDDDHKKLAELYDALAKAKPPQGDPKSWETKTTALAAAAHEVAEKKAGAVDKLKAASDCKACHSLHKPK